MIVLAGVAVTLRPLCQGTFFVPRSFCTRNSWLRTARMKRRSLEGVSVHHCLLEVVSLRRLSLEVVCLRQWSLEVVSRRQWGRSTSRSSTAIKLRARLMSPPALDGDECPSLALAGTQTSPPAHSRSELPAVGLVCFWPFFSLLNLVSIYLIMVLAFWERVSDLKDVLIVFFLLSYGNEIKTKQSITYINV